MRVMITRPREDARPLAEALAARGIEALIEPLLEIVPVPGAHLDLAGVQAVLLTSANGARALAAAAEARDVTVLAVGAATAAAAAAVGFARVEAAGGDVAALADLAASVCDPAAGALVHVAGSHVAGDLAGRLTERGFTLRRETLYTAERAEALSDAAVAALRRGAIDAVLLFSPRTAGSFVTLAARAGVTADLARVRALCLSAAVAEAAGTAAWRALDVAARPDQEALLALVAG